MQLWKPPAGREGQSMRGQLDQPPGLQSLSPGWGRAPTWDSTFLISFKLFSFLQLLVCLGFF